jgi:hypothetical protein
LALRNDARIAGSDGGDNSAVVASLIETCRLRGLDPTPGSPTCAP